MRLEQKVAIVTGGANGIGRATALLFAREGARVVVADRDVSAGESCVASIRADGGDAFFVLTDISKEAEAAFLVEGTVERYGGLDILVNCAGIDVQGTVVNTDPERWHRVLDVNLAGAYLTCRFAIPHMIRRGGGSIINVASIQGMFGFPNYAAYAASKAALIGLTRQIAVDYAEHNIRANAISPGAITTRLGENTARLEPALARAPSVPSPAATIEERPQAASTAPAPRSRLRESGRPEDIAYAALYLASDEAAHVSGHNLVVDGGATAAGP
ncbi:MAG TPA: glucose 1-dehydrogenase [Chthonomonadaceae bacterium]|nr:glucose 1-dehydrogenase [Chthonomonadaceae bacterium]